MKAKDILTRYAAGERDFRQVNLRGADFQEATLVGADFREADIRGTNFRNAKLQDAKFNGAKAGLQKRWVVILLLSSWIMAALSGISSFWTAFLITLIFNSPSLDSHIAGRISLLVLLLFYYVTFRQGILAGFTSVAVAVTVTGTVAVTLAGDVAGAIVGAVAAAGIVAGLGTVVVAIAVVVAVAVAGDVAGIVAVAIAVTGAIVGTVAGAGSLTVTGVVVGIIAVIGVLLATFLSWRTIKGDPREIWIRNIAIFCAAIGGTSFREANLTDADFTGATLTSTDLREAILMHTCWKEVKHLDRVRPGNSILVQPEVQKLLRLGDGYQQSYEGMNLRGANLMGANLNQANLKSVDLRDAILTQTNLEDANLTASNAKGADFTGAWLTGACLAAWNINATTKLDKVDCRYVFLQEYCPDRGHLERRPQEPGKDFEPGDFAKLYSSMMHGEEIIPRNRDKKKAFTNQLKVFTQNQRKTKGTKNKGKVSVPREEQSQISSVSAARNNPEITRSAFRNLSKTVTVAINRLPANPKGDRTNLKEILTQFQTAIEADPNLDDDDKAEILKQVQVLAKAGNHLQNNIMRKKAKRSTAMLTGLITGLSSGENLVTQWQEIVPLIQGFFDFSLQDRN